MGGGGFVACCVEFGLFDLLRVVLRWGLWWGLYVSVMGKKKGSSSRSGSRTRVNPLTGAVETVSGTKAGKKRVGEAPGSPLRTHDRRA